MKSRALFLAISAAALTAVSLLPGVLCAEPFEAPAFTAVKTITSYDRATGEIAGAEQLLIAVRSDGSRAQVRTRTAPDGTQHEQKTIIDVTARKRLLVDGLTDSLTTYPLSEKAVLHYAVRPVPSCKGADEEAGEMFGFPVRRREREVNDGGDTIHFEEWVAPELNCMVMKRVVRIGEPGGPLRLASVEEITTLTRGEPAASMFALPDRPLTERSPGEVFAEYSRRYGKPVNAGAAAILDRSYQAHRRQR